MTPFLAILALAHVGVQKAPADPATPINLSTPGNPLKLFLTFENHRRIRIEAYPSNGKAPEVGFHDQFVNFEHPAPDDEPSTWVKDSKGRLTMSEAALRDSMRSIIKRFVSSEPVSDGYILKITDESGAEVVHQHLSIKDFTPTEIAGEKAYTVAEKFSIDPKEAFFGLGGHQDGALNYRGATETLVQTNRETAVPFLLSSKGYGILNNLADSQTVDLGGPRAIPGNQLMDDNGVRGGLTAHFYKGQNFETYVGDRRETELSFTSAPIPDLGANSYSIRFTGTFLAPKTGSYTFTTRADDGARFYLDGNRLIDDWKVKAASNASTTITLEKGSQHAIRIDYFQAGGGAEFSLTAAEPLDKPVLTWTNQFADKISYDVILGPSFDKIIAEYRRATGQAPMFAKSAYGFWQCKERYKSQRELLSIGAEFRERSIPIDNLVQDWFYWDPNPWGSHIFDTNRYPNIARAIQGLHNVHINLMLSVWAKFKAGSDNFDELEKAGGLLPNLGGPYDSKDVHYYDAFNPKARKIYWDQMRRELLTKGFDAWWLDASEPEVPMEELAKVQTGAGLGARVLNAYPLEHTGAVYNGQRKDKPDSRVFILTRSAYLGQQRNAAATWSGDINGDWQTFAHQIPSGLNFCMSGIPYWCTDIGGFFSRSNTDPDYKELFTRWFQFGTFCPIFRVHGTGTDKEPWRWGNETEAILTKFDKLRYRLMPYIYSVASQVTRKGYTMMRGLAMDFRTDPKVYDIKDEFMFGPAFLVAPVIKPKATSRSVYLPAGLWYDFWTNRRYVGGRSYSVAAPIDSMPLFVRAGSVVPLGPDEEYATEKRGPIEARVYPGASGSFELYDDASDGYGYEKGEFWTEIIGWDQRTGTVYSKKPHGSYPGLKMPLDVRFKIVRPSAS